MKMKSIAAVALAALILAAGSVWAGDKCCKSEKKESTCQKENVDKNCPKAKECDKAKECEKAKDPNCPKSEEAKPAA